MIGRQLPFIAAFLPFYVMGAVRRMALHPRPLAGVAGRRRRASAWLQFAASNYLDYTLTDVFAALGVSGGDAIVPAGMAAGSGSGVRHFPLAE
jgi:lactate permease